MVRGRFEKGWYEELGDSWSRIGPESVPLNSFLLPNGSFALILPPLRAILWREEQREAVSSKVKA